MPTVGEQLRAAREAQQLTIQQIGETTKIRSDHLLALETGDYDRFVAPVYIRGFVRSYVRVLKLDEAQILAGLDQELSQTKKFREDPSLTPPKRGLIELITYQISRINWPRAGLALLVLLLLALVIWGTATWKRAAKADPLSGIHPPVYQPASNPAAGDSLPLPPPPPGPRP